MANEREEIDAENPEVSEDLDLVLQSGGGSASLSGAVARLSDVLESDSQVSYARLFLPHRVTGKRPVDDLLEGLEGEEARLFVDMLRSKATGGQFVSRNLKAYIEQIAVERAEEIERQRLERARLKEEARRKEMSFVERIKDWGKGELKDLQVLIIGQSGKETKYRRSDVRNSGFYHHKVKF